MGRWEPHTLLDAFLRAAPHQVEDYASGHEELTLPMLSPQDAAQLADSVAEVFRGEPNVLHLAAPIVVIGDIHGHVLDLYRILRNVGNPNPRIFLFLGDIVDRGEFCIEALAIVYLMKMVHPEHVYIIRGNHEFEQLCSEGGFQEQFLSVYPQGVYDGFIASFDCMPIAAFVEKEEILAVHGGLGPHLQHLSDLDAVLRPVHDFGACDVLDEILWGDPGDGVDGFEASPRGVGYLFGENATADFCTRNSLKGVIRAHEVRMEGAASQFGGKLRTVFSASNYCGTTDNRSAVLVITPGRVDPIRFQPLPWLLRSAVKFEAVRQQRTVVPRQPAPAGRLVAAACREHPRSPAPPVRLRPGPTPPTISRGRGASGPPIAHPADPLRGRGK